MRVVLASASPRRRVLLSLLLNHFQVEPTDIDETRGVGESPVDYVTRLACEKARAHPDPDAIIIAADTTVALGDSILGKPADRADAARMLESLSDKDHAVHTAVAVRQGNHLRWRLSTSTVTFAPLSQTLIDAYLATDEPWDKAGGYGIQGFAGSFVSNLNGSYSAVVGLPLLETRELLDRYDIVPAWQSTPRG